MSERFLLILGIVFLLTLLSGTAAGLIAVFLGDRMSPSLTKFFESMIDMCKFGVGTIFGLLSSKLTG